MIKTNFHLKHWLYYLTYKHSDLATFHCINEKYYNTVSHLKAFCFCTISTVGRFDLVAEFFPKHFLRKSSKQCHLCWMIGFVCSQHSRSQILRIIWFWAWNSFLWHSWFCRGYFVCSKYQNKNEIHLKFILRYDNTAIQLFKYFLR